MLTSVAVTVYTVQAGDCLSSIADKHGFADWRTVYDHEGNAEFRKKRPDPNTILPGDTLHVPEPKLQSYSLQTGQTHTFVVARPQTRLCLALEVEELTKYELNVAGERFTGSVSDATPFEHPIPCDATEAELTIWAANDDTRSDARTFMLRVGYLHPIEERSGVLGRLTNLGYYDGDLGTPDDVGEAVAIRRFQVEQQLEPTGQMNDKTRDALKKRHDG